MGRGDRCGKTVLRAPHGGQVVEAAPGSSGYSAPSQGRGEGTEGTTASGAFHLQHSRTTLRRPWPTPGTHGSEGQHGVSHAGHLWEAWQHNPSAFDPWITHHHRCELDSFLLPITIHKLAESAPHSTHAADLSGYGLTPLPHTHLLEAARTHACAQTCPLSSRWTHSDCPRGRRDSSAYCFKYFNPLTLQ